MIICLLPMVAIDFCLVDDLRLLTTADLFLAALRDSILLVVVVGEILVFELALNLKGGDLAGVIFVKLVFSGLLSNADDSPSTFSSLGASCPLFALSL